MKLWRPLTDRLAPLVGKWYLSLVYRTTKIEYRGREYLDRLEGSGRPFIYAFWHGRLAFFTAWQADKQTYLIVSQHGDGEIIARIAKAFNKPSVRGSTTRGAGQALRSLVRLLRKGHFAAISPDGPQGPRQVCQPGVIALARMTGHPILPVTYSVQRKRFLGSWDRFLFPYPFNRAVIVIAPPIEVGRDCDKDAMEAKRLELENRLNTLTEEADAFFGGE